jgi:hypothetical protein
VQPENGHVFAEDEQIALTWTDVGPGIAYDGTVEGGPSGSGSFGTQGATHRDIGALPAGYDYTWRIRASGPGGNSPWSEAGTFSVQLAAPTNLQAETLSCTEVGLSWADSSAGEDGYRIYEDGALAAELGANAETYVAGNQSDGVEHTFRVRAFRGESESAAGGPVSVTTPLCDTTPPQGSFADPEDGSTLRQQTVRLDANVSDAGSGVDRVRFLARWDGQNWQELATITESPYRLDWDVCAAAVPDGPVDLRLRVFDGAGNETSETIAFTKRVNCGPNDPPSPPRIENPPADALVSGGAIPIEITASDSYDTPRELQVELRVDGGAWTAANYNEQTGRFHATWVTNGSGDGPHSLRARATDSGGLEATSDQMQVTLDNEDEPPRARAGDDFSVTDADGNGSERITLDASTSTHDPQRTATFAWEDRWESAPAHALGSGEQIEADLGLGTHVITLTVTDSLGNANQDELTVTVSPPPDTTAPSASWVAPDAGATISERTVLLGATASDAGGSGLDQIAFQAKWPGEQWSTISTIDEPVSPVGYDWDLCAAGVPDGEIELTLSATDHAGNEFASSPVRRLTKRYDCSPATVASLAVSPWSGARNETIQVTMSGYQGGEEVTVTWDQGDKGKKNKKGKKGKGKKNKKKRKKGQAARIVVMGTTTANANGDAFLSFTVPHTATYGGHQVEGIGSQGNRAAVTFEVAAASASAAAVDAAPPISPESDPAADSQEPAPPSTDQELVGPAVLPPEAEVRDPSPKRKSGKDGKRGRDDAGQKKQKQTKSRDGDGKKKRNPDRSNDGKKQKDIRGGERRVKPERRRRR